MINITDNSEWGVLVGVGLLAAGALVQHAYETARDVTIPVVTSIARMAMVRTQYAAASLVASTINTLLGHNEREFIEPFSLVRINSGIEQYSNPDINAIFGASIMTSVKSMMSINKVTTSQVQPMVDTFAPIVNTTIRQDSMLVAPIPNPTKLQNICIDPCVNEGQPTLAKKAFAIALAMGVAEQVIKGLKDGSIIVNMLEEDEE